jgi:hypothetical protein
MKRDAGPGVRGPMQPPPRGHRGDGRVMGDGPGTTEPAEGGAMPPAGSDAV